MHAVAAGAQWSLAMQQVLPHRPHAPARGRRRHRCPSRRPQVLQPPSFDPPGGVHGPLRLRIVHSEPAAEMQYVVETGGVAAGFPNASSPVFRDDAGIGLARPSTDYSVAAYATCALCGMARSAAARARYEIVAGCLPPAAKSSATLKASAPAHVCAGGIDNGQPCFGPPAAQRSRPRVPREGAA